MTRHKQISNIRLMQQHSFGRGSRQTLVSSLATATFFVAAQWAFGGKSRPTRRLTAAGLVRRSKASVKSKRLLLPAQVRSQLDALDENDPVAVWWGDGSVDGKTPRKSESDRREYRIIVLKNSMQVLLVQDKEADISAAALSCGVGHLKDPSNLPGLAHFLEHMIHLGSKKYPAESHYKSFLAQHGGSSNASTSADCTKYVFDVQPAYFEEALDIFSALFANPLMSEDAAAREVQAVHNEFSRNLSEDGRRHFQLLKEVADPMHCFHKFGTGNKTTLCEMPQAQGVDVRSALLSFYRTWYTAPRMRLVLVAKDGLDTLEEHARQYFSGVPVKPFAAADVESYSPEDLEEACAPVIDAASLPPCYGLPTTVPVSSCDRSDGWVPPLGKVVRWLPLKDSRSLVLRFPMPRSAKDAVYRSSSLLSHLVGHEGQGSALSFLKKKGWVSALSAGASEYWPGSALFSVTMSLTADGVSHSAEIAQVILAYSDMLRLQLVSDLDKNRTPDSGKLLQRIYLESAALSQTSFRFQAKQAAYSYAKALCERMQSVPGHRLLDFYCPIDSPFPFFCPDHVGELLTCLRSDNMVAFLKAREMPALGATLGGPLGSLRTHGGTSKLTEPHYGTEYDVVSWGKDAKSQLLMAENVFTNSSELKGVLLKELRGALNVPPPNPYVCSEFGVVGKSELFAPSAGGTALCCECQRAPGSSSPVSEGGAECEDCGFGTWLADAGSARSKEVCRPGPRRLLESIRHAPSRKQVETSIKDMVVHPLPSLLPFSPGSEGALSRVFVATDHHFLLPKVRCYAKLSSPLLGGSPQIAVLADLLCDMVDDYLTEEAYAAELAGSYFSLSPGALGIYLRLQGYPEKLPLLARVVAEALVQGTLANEGGAPALTEARFARIQDLCIRSYQNWELAQPHKLASSAVADILAASPTHHSSQSLLEAARGATLQALSEFAQRLWGYGLLLELLVSGSADAKYAQTLERTLSSVLKPAEFSPASRTPEDMQLARTTDGWRRKELERALFEPQPGFSQIALLVPGNYLHLHMCKSKTQVNSAVVAHFQLGEDTVSKVAHLKLLARIMKQPCFSTLRTKQQLGYLVWSYLRRWTKSQSLNLQIVVQSSSHSPPVVETRVEAFLVSFRQDVLVPLTVVGARGAVQASAGPGQAKTGHQRFAGFQAACIAQLLEKPQTLASQASRDWQGIESRRYHVEWRRHLAIARQMLLVTPDSLLAFFDTFVAQGAPERRKLSSWAFGCKHLTQLEWAKNQVETQALGKNPIGLDCPDSGDGGSQVAKVLRMSTWVGGSAFGKGSSTNEASTFRMFREAHCERLQPAELVTSNKI